MSEPAEVLTKTTCCALYGWSRYEFDRYVQEGLPYLEAAAHKGAQWLLDPDEVAEW